MATILGQSLPFELTSLIFSLAQPLDASYVYSREHSPINVSQVCSSWRDVALETASLWSHLALPSGTENTHYEDVWSLWLARSKDHTLRFTIFHQSSHNIALQRKLVQIMVDNFDRWRDIHIALDNIITIIIPYFPPTLEGLYCKGFSVTYRMPSMTRKLISNSAWSYANECHTVTAVDLHTVPQLYEELSGATRMNNDSDEDINDARLSQLTGRTHHEGPNLFASSLRCLEIFRSDYYYGQGKFDFADLICRSTASIEILNLFGVNISTIELCSVLLHSSKLKVLGLASCYMVDKREIYNLLRIHSDPMGVACPALQVLEISGVTTLENESDGRPFLNMIVSRWKYAKSIGISLSIDADHNLRFHLSSEQRQELRNCVLEGLHYEGDLEGLATP